jgi:hypothetical protein
VRAAVTRALATVDRLGGILVVREHAAGGELRWRFVLDARGNFRAAAQPSGPVWAYDAAGGVERNSDEGLFTVRSGIAPGPPDPTSSAWMVQRGLGAVVRALAAAGDASVRELEYRGRPAWLLRTGTQNAGETREVTVDRETGIPVRDVRTYRGTRSEWRIDELTVGGAVDSAAFRLAPRPRQEVTRFDHGFERTTLAGARAAVGYDPLVPDWVPPGFARVEVAVARSSRPTGNEQRQNPPSQDVVSVAYRRGLDEIVVAARRGRIRSRSATSAGRPSRRRSRGGRSPPSRSRSSSTPTACRTCGACPPSSSSPSRATRAATSSCAWQSRSPRSGSRAPGRPGEARIGRGRSSHGLVPGTRPWLPWPRPAARNGDQPRRMAARRGGLAVGHGCVGHGSVPGTGARPFRTGTMPRGRAVGGDATRPYNRSA